MKKQTKCILLMYILFLILIIRGLNRMTKNTIPSAEDLYKRAQDIKPVLKSRAEETAKLRRLTDETIQDFKDLGFFFFF